LTNREITSLEGTEITVTKFDETGENEGKVVVIEETANWESS